jgi:hypothetical protein
MFRKAFQMAAEAAGGVIVGYAADHIRKHGAEYLDKVVKQAPEAFKKVEEAAKGAAAAIKSKFGPK